MGVSKMIFGPRVHLAQTVQLSYTDTNTISEWTQNKIPHDPHHLGVPLSASKMIPELMVCLAQTVHLCRVSSLALSPNGPE
jgi:hypothetical protein